jgi:N-glycosidase YbiA
MSGIKCEANYKKTGLRCTSNAKYTCETGNFCGVHVPASRKNDQYLIGSTSKKNELPERPIVSNTVRFSNNVSGPYKVFSNFAPITFLYRDITWSSSEQAFQCMKFYYEKEGDSETNKKLYEYCVLIVNTSSPAKCKELGMTKDLPIRNDWDQIENGIFSVKDRFMFEIVLAKFGYNREARDLLLSTEDKILEEASPSDNYWGTDGTGKNRLGQILMMIRTHFRKLRDF